MNHAENGIKEWIEEIVSGLQRNQNYMNDYKKMQSTIVPLIQKQIEDKKIKDNEKKE